MLTRIGIIAVAMATMFECAPPPTGEVAPPPTSVAQNTRPVVGTIPTPSVAQTAPEGPMVPDLTVPPTTVPVLPLVNPDSPCQEWVSTAVDNGWPEDREVIERMVAIMWRESRCQPDAYKADDPNGGSLGLLQINQFWCRPSTYWPSGYLQAHGVLDQCLELFDPSTNLRAGWVVYSYSYQRHGGNGWNPWKV